MWILYLALIVSAIPPTILLVHRIIFFLYALFVFWILYPALKHDKSSDMDTSAPARRVWIALLVFSGLFLVASRLIMFIRYGATPLGYDTGFYWQYFNLVVPAGTIGTAMGSHIAYSSWFPLGFMGLPPLAVIQVLHIFHQFLIAGALYFFLRSLPFRKHSFQISVLGVFLFALSINQFMAFWWMFYKQTLALPFLLLAMGLFLRRSWLAIPVAAFAAAIHLSSAIPLGGALVLFLIFQVILRIIKKHPLERGFFYIIFGGIATVVLIFALKGANDVRYYLDLLIKYKGFATTAPSWEIAQIKGLFIPFSTFRLNALFYIPSALMGVMQFHHWLGARLSHRTIIIPTIFALSLILVTFPFIHQNRSLIFFDILLIIFSVGPLFHFIHHFTYDRLGKIIPGLLFIGIVSFTSQVVWNQQPQLYADEAKELKVLKREGTDADIRKIDDYVMATSSFYTPWVYAFTGFESTIVPGWLTWDKWSLDMWNEFWFKGSNARRLELLQMYGDNTIYIFIGHHQLENINTPQLKDFIETDPHFTRFSPHIWKYTPQPENTTPSITL